MILGEIVFFTPENMSQMWEHVRTLLTMVSPGVMISAAFVGVGLLLTIVINSFKQAASPRNDDDEDDGGYEIRRY